MESFISRYKKKKKNLINWKEKRKERRSEEWDAAGNLVLIKLMIKGECVLTALRVLNGQRAHYGTHFFKRCVSYHKMHIPEDDSFV